MFYYVLLSSKYTFCSSEYCAFKLYYDVGYYGIDHLDNIKLDNDDKGSQSTCCLTRMKLLPSVFG